MLGQELSISHLPPNFYFVSSLGKENSAWQHARSSTLQGGAGQGSESDLVVSGKVEMGASPSGPAPNHGTIPTDICPSHYKSRSKEPCCVLAKVPFPGKPLHTSPFHPKVPTFLCFGG